MGILEAMGHGLPIIAFNVGGIKEIVTNAREGYLLDKRNPIEFADKIINDTSILEDMYEEADALIFTHPFTTAFGFSMATNKKIVYFLYEKERYIPELEEKAA